MDFENYITIPKEEYNRLLYIEKEYLRALAIQRDTLLYATELSERIRANEERVRENNRKMMR